METQKRTKAQTLAAWKALPDNQDPLPSMRPIPYKAKGSTYGACGVRIDGNPAFVDAILSRLKPLLDGENHVTRLGLSRREVAPVFDKGFENADAGAEVCYVRLHTRGGQGSAMSAVFDRELDGATERFAVAQGVSVD